MIYAHDANGEPIRSTPGAEAFCPECHTPLTPKCGGFVIWHFAHRIADPGCTYKPESEWHLRWKAHALEYGWKVEQRFLGPDGNYHRADIVTARGNVIELQHTTLDAAEIRQRENAYGVNHLAWIYDGSSMLARDGHLFDYESGPPEYRYGHGRLVKGKEWSGGFGFRIRNGPKTMTLHEARTFWHFEWLGEPSVLWKVDLALVDHDGSERVIGRAHDVTDKWLQAMPVPTAAEIAS